MAAIQVRVTVTGDDARFAETLARFDGSQVDEREFIVTVQAGSGEEALGRVSGMLDGVRESARVELEGAAPGDWPG